VRSAPLRSQAVESVDVDQLEKIHLLRKLAHGLGAELLDLDRDVDPWQVRVDDQPCDVIGTTLKVPQPAGLALNLVRPGFHTVYNIPRFEECSTGAVVLV